MKIKIINFGLEEKYFPKRKHYNDAGADLYSPETVTVHNNETVVIDLKFGRVANISTCCPLSTFFNHFSFIARFNSAFAWSSSLEDTLHSVRKFTKSSLLNRTPLPTL